MSYMNYMVCDFICLNLSVIIKFVKTKAFTIASHRDHGVYMYVVYI